jgi:pimeloyl-ACP methyl ester carboxylesterase
MIRFIMLKRLLLILMMTNFVECTTMPNHLPPHDNSSIIRHESFAKVSDDITLWYETFGDSKNPPIVLLMGNATQGIFWPTDFCEQLASKDRYVIRFDYRDVGLSTHVNYDKHPYDFLDMTADIIGLLKFLNIKKAHLVGLSMGGVLAQVIAINHPDHVLSVTYTMSTSDYRP